jgi:hypothetical protein
MELIMLKKSILLPLTLLLAFPFAAWPTAVGAQQRDAQAVTIENIQSQIAKLGVGEKAKATVTLRDGKKTKGYVSRSGEDDFVIRDRKTGAATTILYRDVALVESNRGHSTANHIAIGVGIGVGAFLTAMFIILTHLD